MNSHAFGRRLRECREAAGKSQEQVATAAKCSRALISQWESGTPKRVDASTLLRVARYLHTTLEYLLEGKDHLRESAGDYAPNAEPLDQDWRWLTAQERGRVREEVRQMAAHNRSVIEQIGSGFSHEVVSNEEEDR